MDSAPPSEHVTDRHRFARAGVSLLETMIVIATLGVLATLVGLSARVDARSSKGAAAPAAAVLDHARRRALASGTFVTVTVPAGSQTLTVTVMPDGRLVGAEQLGFDPLTARPLEATSGSRATIPDLTGVSDSSRSRGRTP